jgi:hypothetical protein
VRRRPVGMLRRRPLANLFDGEGEEAWGTDVADVLREYLGGLTRHAYLRRANQARLGLITSVLRERTLTAREARYWLYLQSFDVSNSGYATVGDERAADELGVSTRTVRDLRKKLEEKGWLRTELQGPNQARKVLVVPDSVAAKLLASQDRKRSSGQDARRERKTGRKIERRDSAKAYREHPYHPAQEPKNGAYAQEEAVKNEPQRRAA